MGPTPILEMTRAYGLRPRLWFLVVEMTWYLPALSKLKYIRDIAICQQNMATKRVEESNVKG